MLNVQYMAFMRFDLLYRLIARLAALWILLILLTGCVLTSFPAPSLVPTDVTKNGGTATLVFWNGWSTTDRQVLNRLVARFNMQQAARRIVVQAVPLATFGNELRGQLEIGNGPDIMLMPNTWIGNLAESGALLSLDDWISPSERQQLLSATVASARGRGSDGAEHLYGLPMSFDTLALYYNTANVLTPPADTADLLALAHGLSDPGATPPRWGLAYNLALDTTIGYFYAMGGRVFDEQGKLVLGSVGRAGTERWLTWLLQLSSDERQFARAGSSIQFDRQLTNNSALMAFDWAHQLTFYRSLWGNNLGVAPLPRLTETGNLPQPYVRSDVLAISSRLGTDERQAAIDFLRFMVSEAAQRELLRNNIQPTYQDLNLDQSDLDQSQARAAPIFRQQAEQGIPVPYGSPRRRNLVRQELEQMLQQVLLHGVSPTDAVTETDQRLREVLGPCRS